MKKYLITGLIILLPVTLTVAILLFVFNLLTAPFAGVVSAIMAYYGVADTGFLFFTPQDVQEGLSKILVLAFLFFFTVLLGMLARWVFIHYFIQMWEYALKHIPFVHAVYRTCQDVIHTFFTSNGKSFKQVALVPFPHADTYSIGLVTRKGLTNLGKISGEDLVAVFVPATPNPTSGFLVLYKESDIHYINMKTEEAFKYIISCGVIVAPVKSIPKDQAQV